MIQATFKKFTLQFKQPSGTSRGVLKSRDTWFIKLETRDRWGIGECAMLKGLSADDRADFENKLRWACNNIDLGEVILLEELKAFPAIQMGLEMAFSSLASEDPFLLFPSNFSNGNDSIQINGLIWMGEEAFMKQQIEHKLKSGFTCIKLKIGAIDFKSELSLLKSIRAHYSPIELELRVDANGAFTTSEALDKLKRLSELELHSIEQPIQPGRWQEMARLCEESPLAIALDEELIGVFNSEKKRQLLNTIQPQYIILKPTLIGGFTGSDDWISIASQQGSRWWVTSALESNVGLNAISQYTFIKNSKLPQGLGTGDLFTNNIDSPLELNRDRLSYNRQRNWNLEVLNF